MALIKRVYTDGETIITAQNLNDIQDEIISLGNNAVPKTRTVNGKALSGNVTLNASDIPNDSSVSGEKVDDALETLDGNINDVFKFANTLEIELEGAKVSIIGDSISTYDATGYKYDSYEMYYPTNSIPDVNNVNRTWWKMLLDITGATIEVNASYSGSCASSSRSGQGRPSFYDRCSSAILGNPDVIIVALGSNDSGDSVPIGDFDYDTPYQNLSEATFANAYIKGVKALKALYPNAKIICVSLRMDNNMACAISYIASTLSCTYVYCGSYVGAVGIHPSYKGMRQITANVLLTNPSFTGGYGLMTGSAIIKGNYILNNSHYLKDTPSATQAFNRFVWNDLTGAEIARLSNAKYTNGDVALLIRSHNLPSDAYNSLELRVKADGTPAVSLEQQAWLQALSAAKVQSFGFSANETHTLQTTATARFLLVITYGGTTTSRYGVYIVSGTNNQIYSPIPILESSAVSFTANGTKTLTMTTSNAGMASLVTLYDEGTTTFS